MSRFSIDGRFGTDARTINFLEGGTLALPTVKAPYRSPEQMLADKLSAERAKQKQIQYQRDKRSAQNAQVINQKYQDLVYEQQRHTRLMKENSPEGEAYRARHKIIHGARTDWGLIPMGAKVIATGAAVIASGGAVAGALGVTAAAGISGGAVAADRLLAAADKGVNTLAKKTVHDIERAAKGGNINAQAANDMIQKVAKERKEKKIPPGVEQPITATGRQAVDQLVIAAQQPQTPIVIQAVARAGPEIRKNQKALEPSWFEKVLGWFGLELKS